MSWFKKLVAGKRRPESVEKKGVPEGLWTQCAACGAILYVAELERNLNVCPKCDHHLRIGARQRIGQFLDPGEQTELATDVLPTDPLRFRDSKKYKDRLAQARKQTGERDALVVVKGRLLGLPLVVAAFEFGFIGGSMGAAVGESFVRAVSACIEGRLPLVCFVASGGARMQEGLISLMQMAKTAAALTRLSAAGLPFISVLTDPTTGGVSASFATLGDIIVAEPKALIGFAGPRVIEQTVRQILPAGFQRSEYLLQHGALDLIVHRRDLRATLSRLLAKLTGAGD